MATKCCAIVLTNEFRLNSTPTFNWNARKQKKTKPTNMILNDQKSSWYWKQKLINNYSKIDNNTYNKIMHYSSRVENWIFVFLSVTVTLLFLNLALRIMLFAYASFHIQSILYVCNVECRTILWQIMHSQTKMDVENSVDVLIINFLFVLHFHRWVLKINKGKV